MAELSSTPIFAPRRWKLGDLILIAASSYIVLTGMSIVTAHVVAVLDPASGLPERLVRPVGLGLAFVDAHWKALLIVVAPVAAPLVRDLARRLRKAGGMEFDVDVQTEGPREKPSARKSSIPE